MQFNHDNMIGVHLAVDLVNLDSTWSRDVVVDALERRLLHCDGFSGSVLEDLRGWTRRLRIVFDTTGVEERCGVINALLAESVQRVSLATHDGLPPHLHFAEPRAELLAQVRAMTAGGLAVFALEAAGGRLGACPRCDRVFADTSKNGKKTYCSPACANGSAVQRYRQRQQDAAGLRPPVVRAPSRG